MFPNDQNIQIQAGCKFGDRCAYKDTSESDEEKTNPATIAIHIPANAERQMQSQNMDHHMESSRQDPKKKKRGGRTEFKLPKVLRPGNSMDSKLSIQNQTNSGDDEKSSKLLKPRRKSEIHLYGQFFGIHYSLLRTEVES